MTTTHVTKTITATNQEHIFPVVSEKASRIWLILCNGYKFIVVKNLNYNYWEVFMNLQFTQEELDFQKEVRDWIKDNYPEDMRERYINAPNGHLTKDEQVKWQKS